MKPYIVRFVSLEAGKGKTYIASSVLAKLKLKGYIIAAIKHAAHDIDIKGKDSDKYIEAGADITIASSHKLGVIYYSKWIDSLDYILGFINTPIVIVEGFKGYENSDVVAIIDSIDEFKDLSKYVKGNLIAIICSNESLIKASNETNVKIFNKDEIDEIASFIELRALKFLENQLPQSNCGLCGFETCSAFAKAYAIGKASLCPVISDIRLVIDSKDIPLNPFVKNILRSTINGFINSLKGVPQQRKRISIEVVI